MSDHGKEHPDSIGRWWFSGTSVKVTAGVQTTMPVQNRPFDVSLQDGDYVPVVAETGMPYDGSTLVGKWTRDEDM